VAPPHLQKTDSAFSIAYVLTTRGQDLYAEMAFTSALSVRLSNSTARVLLLCDERSAKNLHARKHPLLEQVDDCIPVETPQGDPTFQNRWIKTQAYSHVKTPCLLLDADTLVRGSLSELPKLVRELGVVANHNRRDVREQIYPEDAGELQKLGWPRPQQFCLYANGGFLFFQRVSAVKQWFEDWHKLWLEGWTKTGRQRDQPALNTSLQRSRVRVTELPDRYNFQINMAEGGAGDALIWHFYSSSPIRGRLYHELLKKSVRLKITRFRSLLLAALQASDPGRSLWSVVLAGYLASWWPFGPRRVA
jgi:hypothetical protein